MSGQRQKTDEKKMPQKMKQKGQNLLPTDSQGNIIPGTYNTPIGEMRVKKIEPAKHYDVISFARAMNENFAEQTKDLFSPEVAAVREALDTGIYISWRPIEKPWDRQDCQRVSSQSFCFCGHRLNQHAKYDVNIRQPGCTEGGCACKCFSFVPSRPEEVGEFWLKKRRDFDPLTYRLRCKCKHTHEQHTPYPAPYRCQAQGCSCSGFHSASVCAACDKPWEAHQTLFETEAERKADDRQVGMAWMPFSELPELSKIALTGVDNPNVQTLADAIPLEKQTPMVEFPVRNTTSGDSDKT